jgi:hypothetical protein
MVQKYILRYIHGCAGHILHLLVVPLNKSSSPLLLKKVPIFTFFRQELVSQCSIFTVPGDNSNRLKDKMKPRTTVKKF